MKSALIEPVSITFKTPRQASSWRFAFYKIRKALAPSAFDQLKLTIINTKLTVEKK